jgi:tetratricopeptide (TPR) repeat protein
VTVADRRNAREMSLLERSNASYAIAAQYRPTAELLTHWGNTLRALHKFEEAAGRYQQAADLAPDWYAPRINVAIAYLDRVEHAEAPPPLVHVLYALGSSSDYLGWVSGGDPLEGFLSRIDRALARTGVPEEHRIYQACRPATPRGDYDKMVYLTNAKQCLDKVMTEVNLRAASKPRAGLKGG